MPDTTTKVWLSTFRYIKEFIDEVSPEVDQSDFKTRQTLAHLQAALPWNPSQQNQNYKNELLTVSSINNLLLAINQEEANKQTFNNALFRFASHNSLIFGILSTVSHFVVIGNIAFSLLCLPALVVGSYAYWNTAQKDEVEQDQLNANLLEHAVKQHCEQIKLDLAQKKFTVTYQALCANNPELNKALPTTIGQLNKNLTTAGYQTTPQPTLLRKNSTTQLVSPPPVYKNKLSSPIGRTVALTASLFGCIYFTALKFSFGAFLVALGPPGWIAAAAICLGVAAYFGYQRYQQLKHEEQCHQKLYQLQMNVGLLKTKQDELNSMTTLAKTASKTKSAATDEPALQVTNHRSPINGFRRTPAPQPNVIPLKPTVIAESVCRLVMSGG